ncbi:6398_t:CDS:1 [Funneliformis mosseae]|uniref:6398_t:CDS:1 n=1 Tax=Funneliformis mosseae TaxID=27381 RepID=A0A9N9CKZ4_FUNMO|nr:6398_t:CDS:1 [Funneliformis mosseae]
MISRKLSLFVMIALVCMIFVGLTQSAPLSKRDNAFAKFKKGGKNKVVGLVTFTDIGDKFRVIGKFNDGFKSKNVDDYELILEDANGGLELILTDIFREQAKGKMKPPGTPRFKVDIDNDQLTVRELIEKAFFNIRFKGRLIGSTKIKQA